MREAQFGRGVVGVEWQRRTGQGASTERRYIDPFERVEQAIDIATQSPRMGEQMMRQQHWLGTLEVRIARQVHLTRGIGAIGEHGLQVDHATSDDHEFALAPQTHIGGALIVATAAGVHLRPGSTRQLSDTTLDRCVYVFIGGHVHEPAAFEFGGHLIERHEHLVALGIADDPASRQPAHMGA